MPSISFAHNILGMPLIKFGLLDFDIHAIKFSAVLKAITGKVPAFFLCSTTICFHDLVPLLGSSNNEFFLFCLRVFVD